jgi:prolyl-tRNA synthetase
MVHGDDRGLRLPPRVAPHQVVIVPIGDTARAAAALADDLRDAGVRVRVDDRPEHRPGFKFHETELKGVPLRFELGARDLEAGVVTVARRDQDGKRQVPLQEVAGETPALLDDIQAALFEAARAERERRTLRHPGSYDELIGYLRDARGFAIASWCGDGGCERRVKDDSTATIRCLPDAPAERPACVCCGRPSVTDAAWAQAY